MSWNARYALLLTFSTVVTRPSGYALNEINTQSPEIAAGRGVIKKKLVVAVSLIVNLGALAFFK